MKDKDILDLLGLTDKKITLEYDIIANMDHKTLEQDILNVMTQNDKLEQKKKEFMEMFRYCFQDIIKEFQDDPKQQIAVNCSGCRFSNRTELGYGKSKTIRSKTNGYKKER